MMNDCGSQKQSISCDEWFWFAKTKAFHAMNDTRLQKPKHFMQWMILVRKNKSISCDEWFTFAKAKAFHAMNDTGSQKQKHFMQWMIHVRKSQIILCNEWFMDHKDRKSQIIACNEWFQFSKTKAFHAMNDSWITRIAKAKVFHAKKRITTSSLLNTNGCVTSDQCYLVKKVVIVEAENPIGWVEPKKPDLPRFLCTVYFL